MHEPYSGFRCPATQLVALSVFTMVLGCSGADPIVECADAKGHHVVCGFQNPEDLALLDDGRTVVVSQFGGMDGSMSGNIALFDLTSETLRRAFVADREYRAEAGWGDVDCPGSPPQAFSPHGIDVALRPDGRLRLLVVNHGGREAVEAFEITGRGEATRIIWRGCAVPPEGAFMNDVVSLPDGGFLVTHMMDRDSQIFDMLRASIGSDTGFVYEWQPGAGFTPVAGTESPFPNGIELSADGTAIFINLYTIGEVRKVSRTTGEILGSLEVSQPDNSTWGRDGRLLVASHTASFGELFACQPDIEGACAFSFEIVSVDPETMQGVVVFENEGAPMGAATVALDVGGDILMGSFAGDRVMRVRPRKP